MPKYFLLVSVLGLALPAYSQSNYAVVEGTVIDPQHLPVVGATILIKAASTDATRRVVTNQQGLFEAPALLPDDYVLTTEAPGFAPSTQSVRLEVGQVLAVGISLSVNPVRQGLDVTAANEVLQTSDASVGEVIEPRSIREMPLNGRMLIDLVLTVPGAHVGFGAQTGSTNPLYWRPGQRSAVVIGGSRPNANFFLLDGATNTDPTFNTQNLSPSPDAVKEFQVETSSYTADMGGAGGGQINIVTHSGSSQYHGTAYEFLRNGAMDASSFGSMGNNHLVQNNFGASFGGPVAGKRTFFFLNYEGLRLAQADAQILTVPTQAEIQGDFSMSPHKIYDPKTAVANPSYDPTKPTGPTNFPYTRSQFPGNQIPSGRMNPLLTAFLQKYVPMPNMMMAGTADSNNYLDVRNEKHIQDQGTVRVDHDFSNGDTLFGRYTIGTENGFSPSSGVTATTENLPGFGATFDNRSQQAVISWNHIFATNKVNTASFAVSRLSMDRTSQNNGVNDIVSALGIQGVGFGGPGAWGAPWFAPQGYTGIGDTFAATPMHAWDTMYEFRDTYAWQHGRHGIKFGGDFHWYTWPMWGFFQNRGYYQFTTGYTTEFGVNDGSGSGLASMLLSLPAVKQRQAGIPQMNLRNWGSDAFVEDSWQVTRTTTLNVGVRYEYSDPLYDKDNTNTNLVFQDGVPTVFVGGRQGYPRGLMYPNRHNFAPRVGVAKSFADRGLVFHASYGIFFTPVDQNTWCNQRHNVPFVFPETQQADNFTPPAALFASGLNFGAPVLGKGSLPATTVSFTAFDPHAPAQYIQQWNGSVQKSLGKDTSLEVGYLGSRGFHLQRSHLTNNAPPGPGPIGPRRPFKTLSFIPDATLPPSSVPDAVIQSTTFPVSTINLLENTAQSWYDAGYVNVRRRYSHRLSFLANYTYSKNLTNAPDFRSPMDEAAIPQNNSDLNAEKGPGCDVRHRFALSGVYDIPAFRRTQWVGLVTQNWHLSTIYQVESGMPFTISVFGDTANSGTVLGENPIRANVTGEPVFGPGTRTAAEWFNPGAFVAPPAYTFGDAGRNSVYGPRLQSLDFALERSFNLTERASFQFRAEAFNALNKTNLGTPNRFVNTPQFGTITMAMSPARELQVSARLSF
jgi:hypothetical protein